LFVQPIFAQGIRGQITDERGEAVSFATIYVPEISTGTTSNIDGNYELKLPAGKHNVLFQYLGYETQTAEFVIGKSFQEFNVRLITQSYRIPEIKILASGEDPAYYIMRRVIAMAPYYQKQVSKYSCKVYLKGSGVFDKVPSMAKLMMDKNELKNLQEPFVMETVSRIEFELPDHLKQQVLAMRSSGKDNNTSPMGMITNNLYDAEKYGVVSPVGKNALKVYRFVLDGVFEDQGRTINKIRVIPKTDGNDVFSGYIYIADGFWNIHSAALKMHIPMTNVNVHQIYAEVNKNTWMPVSLDFDMDFSGMGFKMKFRYVASISDYKTTLNPALDHTFLDKMKAQQLADQQFVEKTNAENSENQVEGKVKTKSQSRIADLMEKPELSNHETVKLNRLIEQETRRNSPPEPLEIKSAFQVSQKQVNNDSAYWASLRPIPLTESEKTSFAKKDSFITVSAKPEYQDSVRDSKRKFKLKHLILGKTYDYSTDSIRKYKRFSIPKLTDPTSLSFNSVDGIRLELPFSYFKADSSGHLFRIEPHFAYAFARKKIDATLSFQQRLSGMTNSWISVAVGSTTLDFNQTSSLSPISNDLHTLWLERNYKRYFGSDFFRADYRRDLINGLNLTAGFTYSQNSALTNHSSYSFIDYKDREIMPNIPENISVQLGQLENNVSFVGRFALEYTPRNRYRIRNHTKIYAGSAYPTFTLFYQKGFAEVFKSDSQYDFLRFGIRQKIDFGIDDHFSYRVAAGKFLNAKQVYFQDFHHFNTKPTSFMFSSYENSFRLLPFYKYSTSKQFLESHANWQTRRFILKQLPIVKNTSISENLFVNFLTTPDLKNYVETGYGISNIFLLLNVEAVAGFENGKFRSAGIKVSMNLK
jgi:hypothetical protein